MKLYGLVTAGVISTAAGLCAATLPAAADDYYIVRDPDTTTCTIVDTRPRGPLRIIGNIFNSRADAEAQLAAVCRDEAAAPVVIEERERVVVPDDDVVVERERVVPRDDDPVVVEERRTRTRVIETAPESSDERVIIQRD